jgi:hypothetical protein
MPHINLYSGKASMTCKQQIRREVSGLFSATRKPRWSCPLPRGLAVRLGRRGRPNKRGVNLPLPKRHAWLKREFSELLLTLY